MTDESGKEHPYLREGPGMFTDEELTRFKYAVPGPQVKRGVTCSHCETLGMQLAQCNTENKNVHQAYLVKEKQLEIAKQALKEIDPPMNSEAHGCWKIAREAIAKMDEMK